MGDKHRGGRLRYRIVLNMKTDKWYCYKLSPKGKEIDRSPEGHYMEAERFETHMRRFGAWHKS